MRRLETLYRTEAPVTPAPDQSSWSEYYRKVAGRPPRQLLLDALELFPSPGFAVDIGCGGGIETRELLRRGWRVLALDREEGAFEHVTEGLSDTERSLLTTRCLSFAELDLPEVDLVWAGLSLPFAEPATFPDLWRTVMRSIRPGGRFAGDLFGVRHVWRENPRMTFLSADEVQGYLRGCAIERLTEVDEARPTVFDGMQQWHAFAIVARKLSAR